MNALLSASSGRGNLWRAEREGCRVEGVAGRSFGHLNYTGLIVKCRTRCSDFRGDKKYREFTLPNTPEKRNPHLSKDVKWGGGGAFKYYTLEQHEETLRNARYEDGPQLEIDSTKSPFAQYVFFADEKHAHAVKKAKNGELKIDLHKLYPDIDIAETLANALGKPIRTRTADSVSFTDGSEEKLNPAKMNEEEKRHFVSLIRLYLWWGE